MPHRSITSPSQPLIIIIEFKPLSVAANGPHVTATNANISFFHFIIFFVYHTSKSEKESFFNAVHLSLVCLYYWYWFVSDFFSLFFYNGPIVKKNCNVHHEVLRYSTITLSILKQCYLVLSYFMKLLTFVFFHIKLRH